MKRYISIIATAALLIASCAKNTFDSSADNNVNVEGDGTVTLAFDLELQGADVNTINTRAAGGTNWAEKENVTDLAGYAFVFSADPTSSTGYSDDSELLQKVAFKTLNLEGKAPSIYVTLHDQTEPCFIRLITAMTQPIIDEIDTFVSKEDIETGEASGNPTTFAEYKEISVSLLGYYNVSDPATDTPDPTDLTPNLAFPLASPGVMMHDGLNVESIKDLNKTLMMVPPAAKVDVTSACGFELHGVTLLNGARMAHMRSTVISDSGNPLNSLPLPTNQGGVTIFAEAPADNQNLTTAGTPIYFFPNEGDNPDNTNGDISDINKGKNPTYLIIRGKAEGFSNEGYYKVAIRYQQSGAADYTYNIIRNHHYKVNLQSVGNAGYATFDEAVAAPANDISYDITLGNSDNLNQRAETIVSNNGLYALAIEASSIYVRGKDTGSGTNTTLKFKVTKNNNVTDVYDDPKIEIFGDNGRIKATLASTYTIGNEGVININIDSNGLGLDVENEGKLTIRCGNITKEIPVYFEDSHGQSAGNTDVLIGDDVVFDSAQEIVGMVNDENGAHVYNNTTDNFIKKSGTIAPNPTYNGRSFDGIVYPSDMSQKPIKLFYNQASSFKLVELTDNLTADPQSLPEIASGTRLEYLYKSNGEISTIKSGETVIAQDVAGVRRFQILGDVEANYNGDCFPVTMQNEDKRIWQSSKPEDKGIIQFGAENVGTNRNAMDQPIYTESRTGYKSTYHFVAQNDAIVTCSNFAGEVKTYKFHFDQYARANFEHDQAYFDAIRGWREWYVGCDWSWSSRDDTFKDYKGWHSHEYLMCYYDKKDVSTNFSLIDINVDNCESVTAEFIDYPTKAVTGDTGEVYGYTFWYTGGDDSEGIVNGYASDYINKAIDLKVVHNNTTGNDVIQVYRTEDRLRGCGMVYRATVKITAHNGSNEVETRTLEIGVRDDRRALWLDPGDKIQYDGDTWKGAYYAGWGKQTNYWIEHSYNVIGGVKTDNGCGKVW